VRFPRWAVALGALLNTGLAGAQAPGALAGEVREAATGRALAGARILLQPGALAALTSGADGRFVVGKLTPGRYRLFVSLVGYAPDTLPLLDVPPGDTLRVVVKMRPVALNLPGIVVTASRAPERVEEAPASVAVLGGDEIVRRNVNTVDGALAFVPGVTFNGSGQMDIRGSTGSAGGVGSRVLMLVDGHPALSGDGGELIWEALPLLDLDQAEVVKGAASALYGSNALGGVVNLVTTPIGDRPETVLRTHAGEYDLPGRFDFADHTLWSRGIMLQHSRRLGPVGARLAVARETSDGFEQNGEYGRWFLRTKVTAPPESAHPWDAYLMWSRDDAGNFLAWRSPDAPFEVDSASRGDRSVYQFLLAGAAFTPLARPSAVLRVSPSLNWNSNQNYFAENQDHHRATRAGTTVQLSLFPADGQTITLGVDGAATRVSSNFLGTPWLWDAAAFAQDEVLLGRRVTGTLGARLDYHDTSEGADEASLNPKLALVWRAADRLDLRASVARGYRAASAIEQFVSAVQSGFRVIPNPALHGEHAWAAELGSVARASGRLAVDATAFWSEYRDLIGPAVAPDSFFVFQFRNVSRARVRGLDLAMRTSLVPNRLDLEASYLYLGSKDLDTGRPLPYRSKHNVTGTLNVLRGLLGMDLRWRSRVDEVLAFPLDQRGPITTADVRLAWPLFGAVLQAKASNLFDKVYADVQERVPGAPRSFSLTVYAAR
jgi:outer membrane receptor protein involved in Fe transport